MTVIPAVSLSHKLVAILKRMCIFAFPPSKRNWSCIVSMVTSLQAGLARARDIFLLPLVHTCSGVHPSILFNWEGGEGGSLPLVVKELGHTADHSPVSSTEVNSG